MKYSNMSNLLNYYYNFISNVFIFNMNVQMFRSHHIYMDMAKMKLKEHIKHAKRI